MPMTPLSQQSCVACQVGAPTLTNAELTSVLKDLPGWQLHNQPVPQLVKEFGFNNFIKAMAFANEIAELAEQFNHHPAMTVEWGKVTICWWTHKIGGVHQNDAILAAKTDTLFTV